MSLFNFKSFSFYFETSAQGDSFFIQVCKLLMLHKQSIFTVISDEHVYTQEPIDRGAFFKICVNVNSCNKVLMIMWSA